MAGAGTQRERQARQGSEIQAYELEIVLWGHWKPTEEIHDWTMAKETSAGDPRPWEERVPSTVIYARIAKDCRGDSAATCCGYLGREIQNVLKQEA